MPAARTSPSVEARSPCPVSGALDLLGDRWTLLVVRDLFRGKARFADLAESWEGIATNLLTERLRRLEKAGIVSRHAYQRRPVRYEYRLTGAGQALWPILKCLAEWGNEFIPGTSTAWKKAKPGGGAE